MRLLEEITQLEKIEIILDYFGDRPDITFDTSFVEDLQEKLNYYGSLTENQELALDNIIEGWEIPFNF